MENDILLINKPAGMTSFGVVARVRRVLSERAGKKVKVGHTGTLDPFATGLMILVTGKECKNAMTYTKLDKVYQAEISLGATSTTGDPEGDITQVKDVSAPSEDAVRRTVARFTGEIIQTPPIYSAIKIGGRRAYDLARKGEEVKIPSRKVTIYESEVLEYDYPRLVIRTHVSSGTYIRSLASDIGQVLGTGAYCTGLHRIAVGKWSIDRAKELAELGIES